MSPTHSLARLLQRGFLLCAIAASVLACAAEKGSADQQEIENPFAGPSPWPEIRKERMRTLLPQAMEAAGVDAWLILCRENNNDPIAHHVGGENAGGQLAIVFAYRNGEVSSVAFSPVGEATALAESGIHDEVRPIDRGASALSQAVAYLRSGGFSAIAINTSTENALADGYPAPSMPPSARLWDPMR
ncbi:hypothetical protein [Nitritalea halalkaliphila]|uniref:hypothetical protein n=1 Tax=Nitritalea halalkaliphila TaxID=590849 RepID=UPI001EE66B1F|nr:hypothetical protein [Nitritalea halalkaliphila]